MESILHSLSHGKFPKSQVLNSPLLILSNAATSAAFSRHLPNSKCFLSQSQLPGPGAPKAKEKQILGVGAVHASQSGSEATNPTTNASEKWLLEPIGDGDTRHIGFNVEMPGAYEIASSEVTVGRIPEKADLVIPVATVSAVHARIQKKQGNLLVTDLDSTNGTFIDDKRLRPGVVATVSSGSCITFGDTHLAMFRVCKLEDDTAADRAEATEAEQDTDNEPDNTQTS